MYACTMYAQLRVVQYIAQALQIFVCLHRLAPSPLFSYYDSSSRENAYSVEAFLHLFWPSCQCCCCRQQGLDALGTYYSKIAKYSQIGRDPLTKVQYYIYERTYDHQNHILYDVSTYDTQCQEILLCDDWLQSNVVVVVVVNRSRWWLDSKQNLPWTAWIK